MTQGCKPMGWQGRWLRRRLLRWSEAALALVYPPVCQICHAERAVPRWGWVGPRCRREAKPVLPPFCHRCGLPFEGALSGAFECGNCHDADLSFESVRAAVLAEGVVRKVVHRFKYDGAIWFRPFLGRLLVQAARPALSNGHWDVLVPVPLHPTREREREFNQAEVLARFLGERVGVPVRTDLVERVHETPTQTHLGREARQENVRRAFRAIAGRSVKGASVVVVDDVLTTGSTTDAVARQLRRLGAERVCVWVVARAR